MSFWEKIKDALRRFMGGRNGSDELCIALLVVAILCMLVGSFVAGPILSLVSMAAYVVCIFRMFSRNVEKRRSENARFVAFRQKAVTEIKQGWVRLKNIRKYKYLKCPECKARLRLPRKVGEVTVTCGKCHHQFRGKA